MIDFKLPYRRDSAIQFLGDFLPDDFKITLVADDKFMRPGGAITDAYDHILSDNGAINAFLDITDACALHNHTAFDFRIFNDHIITDRREWTDI